MKSILTKRKHSKRISNFVFSSLFLEHTLLNPVEFLNEKSYKPSVGGETDSPLPPTSQLNSATKSLRIALYEFLSNYINIITGPFMNEH